MVTAATLGELFGSSTREDSSSSGGVTVDAGIIAAAAAIMGEIIAAEISTIPGREVVPRRVTFTSRIDHRSEITTSSSNNSRIMVVDGRETPEEEEEDSGTEAGEGRMNSSRSRDRW